MPDAWREAMEAEAAEPTKREATANAFKGMRRESPAKPLLYAEMPHPNLAMLAIAHHHHHWVSMPPPQPFSISFFPLSDRDPTLKAWTHFFAVIDKGSDL